MNGHAESFSETSPRKCLKLCGSCANVNFGLTEEERRFLTEIVSAYGLRTIRKSWIEKGNLRKAGCLGEPDPEKVQAFQLVTRHVTFCRTARLPVMFTDEPCYRWKRRGEK